MNGKVRIIGLDWATQPAKIGYAVYEWDGVRAADPLDGRRVGTFKGHDMKGVLNSVRSWVAEPKSLISIDAPLGWPQLLAKRLGKHQAGKSLGPSGDFDALFSRSTDQFIHRQLQLRPLEVGANLIARTAASALSFLGALAEKPAPSICLFEQGPGAFEDLGVIEVYPKATQLGHGAVDKATLVGQELGGEAAENGHALDAQLCVVAAIDFLRQRCFHPTECPEPTIRREGWIWCADPARLNQEPTP